MKNLTLGIMTALSLAAGQAQTLSLERLPEESKYHRYASMVFAEEPHYLDVEELTGTARAGSPRVIDFAEPFRGKLPHVSGGSTELDLSWTSRMMFERVDPAGETTVSQWDKGRGTRQGRPPKTAQWRILGW